MDNIIESNGFEIHGIIICIDDIGYIVKKYPYQIMAMGSIIPLSTGEYVWNTNLYSDETPIFGYKLSRITHRTSGWYDIDIEYVILPIDIIKKHFISIEEVGVDGVEDETTRIERDRDLKDLLS